MTANLRISIHAPREGSDGQTGQSERRKIYFNPRSPRGERPSSASQRPPAAYFNPRSPRGERPASTASTPPRRLISIHAPREGSDDVIVKRYIRITDFNPRSPRGERRAAGQHRQQHTLFQSTLPARGATMPLKTVCTTLKNFNPRSPRGERLVAGVRLLDGQSISIHAPREGSDRTDFGEYGRRGVFQSTLPARGATPASSEPCFLPSHFNPRSPRGERRL